ncbi:MAG: histidine kinase [Chitinophagaceae bacterium]
MRSLYLAVVICIISMPAIAQILTTYQSKIFGVQDGIPSSDFYTVTQDHLDNIWMGQSMGCTRFNGSSLENYIYAGNRPVGKVYCFKEDDQKRLWVGSENGLFFFDADTLVFVDFKKFQVPVYDISWDSSQNLWLGTGIGPVKIPSQKMPGIIKSKSIDISPYQFESWKKIFPDKHKATKVLQGNNGTVYFSSDDEVVSLTNNIFSIIWVTHNNVDYCNSLLFIDNKLFMSCSISGLLVFDGKNLSQLNILLSYGYCLVQSGTDILYVSDKFIYTINPKTLAIKATAEIEEKYIRWVKQMWKDHEGNFWIATNEGLIYMKPVLFKNFNRKENTQENELYSIYQMHSGVILAGSNHGILYQFKNNNILPYEKLKKVFSRAEIFSIQEDKAGTLWFNSGYEGVGRFKNNHIDFYTTNEGLRDNTNTFFLYTKDGRLFTGGDKGITQIITDSATGKVHFKNFIYTSNAATYSHFNAAAEDKKGNLWVGTEFGLFRLYNDSLYKTPILNSSIPDLDIADLKIDANGDLWIATLGSGVIFCHINNENQPTLAHHFFTSGKYKSNGFLDLLIDRDNIIWIASYNGIFRMEPVTFMFKYYDSGSGFLNSTYKYIELMQSSNGTIWAASSFGTISFDPKDFNGKENLPPIHITKVTQNDSVLFFSPAPGKKEYAIPYSKYSISIYFEEVSFSNPTAINYQYRLLNVDTTWINNATAAEITLRELSPGHYTFEVRASAGGNQWTAPASFIFEITPPFWLNPWLISIVVFGLFAFLFYLLKKRVSNIKKEEARKTELQTIKAKSYQHQLEIEKVTNYFASSISDKNSVDEILWDVAKNCIAKLGFEDCVIYLVSKEKKVLQQKAAWGPKTTEENKIINPIEIPFNKGIVGSVSMSGKGEIIYDTSRDSRYIVDDALRYSEICVPILDQGQVIGVIDSEHAEKGFYTSMHLQILTTIATLCADKIKKVVAENMARDKEIELIKLHRDLAASQLTALRSQMNPHFIFNALNSIQQFILTGNIDDTNKYLSKFSRLQREILNQSDKHFISLEKEIEMLTLYLQLEQLRFDKGFEYKIVVDRDIDISEIKIPPMIMQPFVENSIWHGLMSQKVDKKILVEFVLQSENILLAKIKDTGIGRDASAQLKEKNTAKNQYTSRGLSLITERLRILQQQYNKPFGASISDITDGDGNVLGTEVILSIYIL